VEAKVATELLSSWPVLVGVVPETGEEVDQGALDLSTHSEFLDEPSNQEFLHTHVRRVDGAIDLWSVLNSVIVNLK